MTDSARIVKAHCNRCLGETRHSVVAAKKQEYNEETPDGGRGYWEITLYEMLECCGCENITLRSVHERAGDFDATITYFPPAVTRPTPAWLSSSLRHRERRRLCSLLREVYAALHAGSNSLAMMGARAIIDIVMLDKVGDQGAFSAKLEKMQTEG